MTRSRDLKSETRVTFTTRSGGCSLVDPKGDPSSRSGSTDAPILLRLGGRGPALDQAVDSEQHDGTQQ